MLEIVYLMNARQAVDDAKHNDRIAMRVIGYLNCHSVQQHLIQSVSEQRLRHLTEKVLQHACSINRQHIIIEMSQIGQ